ncbi:MAG TPA: hypothetical protein PL151_00020 [Phycisphaerae bacterium]|nr:hypothetical protein [Phycisphaerae bacterium]HOJ76016.1 hypothetical protein [Phycisphaerae bacterium]HOM52789.1 hypothetical protein [Phycisphaerae bacterium]HON65640.1 hypothetical protein [Phycisphaerae bacterium]HOQ86785.1 hypothetical protein [Phycisphaerae bacterium]
MCRLIVLMFCLMSGPVWAQSTDLAFKSGKPGEFTFDTGRFTGRLVAGEKAQGLVSLIDKASGVELAKGRPEYGIFSFYRLVSSNRRWGGVMWEWPKSATLLPDGGVRIEWPAVAEGDDVHPADITGTYRWTAPDTLDVEATIKPHTEIPRLELFIGSYFKKDTRGHVYLAPTRHAPGKPTMVPVDVTPLTVGTYLAFPRDLAAAQLVFDGRWELGLHPVHWSVTRYMAGPLAVRHDAHTNTSLAIMSRPIDCSTLYCSYNQEPPDGIAGHYSTYLSLFGRDVKSGETARAVMRLVVRKNESPADAVVIYEKYVADER